MIDILAEPSSTNIAWQWVSAVLPPDGSSPWGQTLQVPIAPASTNGSTVAIATSAAPVGTWHIGTRLRQWVDRRTWDELQETFGRFDGVDATRAFSATVALYSRLARELALKLGYPYPAAVESAILKLSAKDL